MKYESRAAQMLRAACNQSMANGSPVFWSANHLVGPNTAVIDDKRTGLAGCTQTAGCDRAGWCLRAKPELAYRAQMHSTERCNKFIPSTPQE